MVVFQGTDRDHSSVGPRKDVSIPISGRRNPRGLADELIPCCKLRLESTVPRFILIAHVLSTLVESLCTLCIGKLEGDKI